MKDRHAEKVSHTKKLRGLFGIKTTLHRRFGASFTALLGINFLVWFAGYQLFPLIPLRLRQLGAGLAESGNFASLLTIGTASGALLMGRLGDRLGQLRTLRSCACLLSALFATYAYFQRPWIFFVLAPVHGLLWAGMKTSVMALAAKSLSPDLRTQGLTLFGLSGALGVSLGPMTGLQLVTCLPFYAVFLGIALFFAVPAFAPGLSRPDKGSCADPPLGPWPGWALAGSGALLFAWGFAQGAFPPFSAQEATFLGTGWTAAALTFHALGMLAFRGLFGVFFHRSPSRHLMTGLVAGGILAVAILALLPGGLIRHMVGGFLFGGSMGLAHTLLFTRAVSLSGERHGEGVGLMYFTYELAMGLGAGVVGRVMEWAGAHAHPAWGFRVGWGAAGALLLFAWPFAGKWSDSSSLLK